MTCAAYVTDRSFLPSAALGFENVSFVHHFGVQNVSSCVCMMVECKANRLAHWKKQHGLTVMNVSLWLRDRTVCDGVTLLVDVLCVQMFETTPQ